MSRYLKRLVKIAQEEIPTLQADATNAAGPFQLREVCLKLLDITHYLLLHAIEDAASKTQPAAGIPAIPPRPAPPPPPPRPPVAAPPLDVSRLPQPLDVAQPAAVPAPSSSMLPGDVPVQPGITNAFITPQGTTVVNPRGQRSVLPAGVAVPLEISAGVPPEPPPAPEGVAQVVLPPGGGMSPEVEAALAARSPETPPETAKE